MVAQVKDNPNDVPALLRLAHLYAQAWIKSGQDDIVQRIEQCLRRAVKIDDGAHTDPILKLTQGLSQRFAQKNMTATVTTLRDLENELNARADSEKHAQATPEPPQPATAPDEAPTPEPEATASEEEEAEDVGDALPIPEISPEELAPRGPESSTPQEVEEEEETSTPEMDVELHVETVAPAPDEKTEDVHTAKQRRDEQRRAALATAEEMSEVKHLFEEEMVEDILSLYAAAMEPREKRYIAEELAKRIEDWGVGPLLAIAALESDEQVFRRIMRLILQSDRAAVCDQIEIDSYSTDLQRVAVVVLSELSIRSALPKLKAALELPDPVVRSVAVHGLGRAGEAAKPFIPDLVAAAETDPHANVKRAAAKALSEMGIREAYEALEEAANKATFDSTIYLELEKMRKRYNTTGKAGKGKGAGPAREASSDEPTKSQGLSPTAKKNLVKAVIYLIILAGACVFLWKQIAPYIIPPDYGP